MPISQAPAPDLSFVQGLDPWVAVAALATIVILNVLYFVGPGLRDRFRPTGPTPTGGAHTAAVDAVPVALPAVMDRADIVSDRYIAHLEQQLADRDRVIADQERESERLRIDLDRLRDQQWRRGTQ